MSNLPEDMTLDRAVPRETKFLTKEDCTPPILATITGMRVEEIEGDHGIERKTVLLFKETKPLVMNQANRAALQDMGFQTVGDIRGAKVELFNDESVMFGSRRVGGVRIRKPSGPDDQVPF